ncbi:MAG: DUF362 domain-containing protein [Candidatus Bathyarchaeota archaeon]|nr:DUF362 domain-containing protein [Candidatus Bathyarchaeota archaeon]
MSRVSIVKSRESPEDNQVYGMVKEAIDKLGGIESIVKPRQSVALKPNVVTGELSGPGVTTDKRVVEAMIKLCKEAGARKVSIVEGAGYFTETSKALELSGIKKLAEDKGAELVDVDKDETVELPVPEPLIIEKIKVSKAFMDADVRINLPVMKTHDQLLVTLGVKNLKGVIPKTMKRNFHKIGVVKGILDLYRTVPVDLTVLDAIVAMEGLGPSFGPKVELNTIIASKDMFALDRVASRIMGFAPEELDYLVEGAALGLTDFSEEVEVVGEPVSSYSYRFERPPTDLEFAEGVTVISDGACSACRGTIHSVVYDLEQMQKMGEIRDLFIVVGSKAEVPEGLSNTPVIMGICQSMNADQGCYVEGCPPNNDKMRAAIYQVCNISD